MAKVLLIVPNLNFRDEELRELKAGLQERGHEFLIVAPETGEAIGMIVDRLDVDRTIDEISVDEYDCVILIGGIGTRQLLYQVALLQLLKEAMSTGKIVGSIGMGVLVLAQAGLVRGKQITGAIEDAARLEERGGNYQKQPVVVDSQLITGMGHESIDTYVQKLLELLG